MEPARLLLLFSLLATERQPRRRRGKRHGTGSLSVGAMLAADRRKLAQVLAVRRIFSSDCRAGKQTAGRLTETLHRPRIPVFQALSSANLVHWARSVAWEANGRVVGPTKTQNATELQYRKFRIIFKYKGNRN